MKKSVWIVLAALTASFSLAAFADEGRGGEHHRDRRGFLMGVCVGQQLAQQGVTSMPKRPWDDATKAQFKKASETCRAQFKNAKNSAAPSSSGASSEGSSN